MTDEELMTYLHSGISIKKFLWKQRKNVLQRIVSTLENYLKKGRVHFLESSWKNGHYRIACRDRLSSENLDRFLRHFQDHTYDYLTFVTGDEYYVEEYSLNLLQKVDPVLKEYKKSEEYNEDLVTELVFDQICELTASADYFEQARAYFEPGVILRLLMKNSRYRGDIKIYERRLKEITELEEALPDKIPERIIDLYPNARSIKRHFILHLGPTNSGKTGQSIEAMKQAKSGIYLAPLRLLAYEQYDSLNRSGVPCTLKTGEEESVVPGAFHQASTIEMMEISEFYDVAVIDEGQMISDYERGSAWTEAILGVYAPEVHICAAMHAKKTLIRLIELCGDTYEIVLHERQTPLEIENQTFSFPQDVRQGDALVVFSRKDVHAVAAEIREMGWKCSIIYGALPYDVRHDEARKFNTGENSVVVATDAIGMGLNMPIKRIVFLKMSKFDGVEIRELNASETQQIAGRAGRRGLFDIGYVATAEKPAMLKKLMNETPQDPENVYLGFPRRLVDLNGKLSKIMEIWDRMQVQDGFEKAPIDREMALAKKLEKITDEKLLIYQFVTIPFDEEDEDLLDIWEDLFRRVLNQQSTDLLESADFFDLSPSDDLEQMEKAYRILDLIYYSCKRFGTDEEANKIMSMKGVLSAKIIKLLEKQEFSVRTCRRCGRKLTWDYPYGICQKCYRRRF